MSLHNKLLPEATFIFFWLAFQALHKNEGESSVAALMWQRKTTTAAWGAGGGGGSFPGSPPSGRALVWRSLIRGSIRASHVPLRSLQPTSAPRKGLSGADGYGDREKKGKARGGGFFPRTMTQPLPNGRPRRRVARPSPKPD